MNSAAKLNFSLMLDTLNENEVVDLYLIYDATGEKYTTSFRKIAQQYRYCRENGLTTDWDLNGLKGSRDKIGKLIDSLGIKPFKEKQVWKMQPQISDKSKHYEDFEDLNEYLIYKIKS